MSKFSERCKKYLAADGHTVYSFSKATGLDRTTLHRLVNGKRLPSVDFLQEFCNELRINARETKEIFELYEEERVGTAIYQNRKYIHRFLCEIYSAEHSNSNETDMVFHGMLSSYTATLPETKIQIYTLLESAFCENTDSPCILMNLPADSELHITKYLVRMFQKYQKPVILKHLLTFAPNPSSTQDVNCNLKNIAQALPLALSDFKTYLPYYTYGHILSSDFSQLLCPYYIMTENAVLEISSDMKRSILHRDPDTVKLYRSDLERIFSEGRSLMEISHTLENSLSLYQNVNLSPSSILSCLETMPCFTWSVPRHLLMDAAQKLLPPQSLPELLQFFSRQPPENPGLPVFFSIEGLTAFLETGQITGQMLSYLPPLTPGERLETLRNFIDANGKNLFSAHLLKLDMSFSDKLYIELLPGQKVLFCVFNPEKQLRFVLLHEPSLYDAFSDFFGYLGSPVNSYTVEETNEIVERMINKYLLS